MWLIITYLTSVWTNYESWKTESIGDRNFLPMQTWVCVRVMLRVSFPSQMGGCAVFQGGCAVFCCGTALTYKLCILLLLDYFHPRNDGFVSCLPFTEHVQTLFTLNWACANSVLGMCRNNLHNLPCFWQFWLITMTETEHEHRLRLVDLTTSFTSYFCCLWLHSFQNKL